MNLLKVASVRLLPFLFLCEIEFGTDMIKKPYCLRYHYELIDGTRHCILSLPISYVVRFLYIRT